MRALLEFAKTTIIGGFVFLVPVVLIAFVIGKAVQLTRRVTEPMATFMPYEAIAGVGVVKIITILVIVLACFLAGLVARTAAGSRFVRSSEPYLWRIPGYGFLKGLVDDMSGGATGSSMHPVLLHLDDASQVAFEVERLTDGRVVVYVPGAPDPRAGSVLVLDAERIEPLPVSMLAAARSIRMVGRGTHEFLGKHTGPTQNS